jgi:hypothetical protein
MLATYDHLLTNENIYIVTQFNKVYAPLTAYQKRVLTEYKVYKNFRIES